MRNFSEIPPGSLPRVPSLFHIPNSFTTDLLEYYWASQEICRNIMSVWHKPWGTFHPWCLCIKTRYLLRNVNHDKTMFIFHGTYTWYFAGVGIVVKAGSGVVDIKEGDRVCTPWMHSACGRCEHCCAGWETVCDQPPSCTGFTVDGSFAEYIKANADYVGKWTKKWKNANTCLASNL